MRPHRLPRPPHINPGVDPESAQSRGYMELIQLTLLALAFVIAASGCTQPRPGSDSFSHGGDYGMARDIDRVQPDWSNVSSGSNNPAANADATNSDSDNATTAGTSGANRVARPIDPPAGPRVFSNGTTNDSPTPPAATNTGGGNATTTSGLIGSDDPGAVVGPRVPGEDGASGPSLFDMPERSSPLRAEKLLKPKSRPDARYTIVIDAGHGGSDAGSHGNGLIEKDLVLPIANDVVRLLRGAGFAVVPTRTRDDYPTLEERAKLAEQKHAWLFLSVHANAFVRTTSRGVETLYPAKGRHAAASQVFGKLVQAQLMEVCPTQDRGARADVRNLYLMRNAPCTLALAEIGFMTNKEDAAYLGDAAKQDAIAVALANAVIEYFNKGGK
ncbi:MAG: N-acetylmuramoyl-L-alanine amidase [Planctomycetota bacterium]